MRFQPCIFDGVVSISALQWLCNWDKKDESPVSRISTFFKWLYNCLKRGARAVRGKKKKKKTCVYVCVKCVP
ncbi:hypothetical protein C923_01216, partial [Plasmodium falciparum UGT5.1]